MASPMTIAVMTKKVLELAEDKRVRTLLESIATGIVIVMLIPLLVLMVHGSVIISQISLERERN